MNLLPSHKMTFGTMNKMLLRRREQRITKMTKEDAFEQLLQLIQSSFSGRILDTQRNKKESEEALV